MRDVAYVAMQPIATTTVDRRDPDRAPRRRGGTSNALLRQLTADACGLPVVAGPAKAAALGNVLVHARALGADLPDLAAMRDLVARHHERVRLGCGRRPAGPCGQWCRAGLLVR